MKKVNWLGKNLLARRVAYIIILMYKNKHRLHIV